MSRQREWQERMKEEGRCIICGQAAVTAYYCERHRNARLERLRERRRRDGEQLQTCGRCGGEGHNRRGCTVPMCEECGSAHFEDEACPIEEEDESKAVRRCGYCKEKGHNVRSCPRAPTCSECERRGHTKRSCPVRKAG